MISFTYDTMKKGEKSQILATFDEQSKRFSFNRLTNAMPIDQDKTVTANVLNGRVSEFLDMLDEFERNQDSNECLKDLLSLCEEKKADYVLVSTLISNLQIGSLSLANVPTRIYKESEMLFYALFGLIPIEMKDEESNDGHMDFYLRWIKYMRSIDQDEILITSLLARSLRNLPSRLKRKIGEEIDLLSMAQIWLDNLHKKEDADTHKMKDRGLVYLLTRPRIDYVEGKLDYRTNRRAIDIDMFAQFIDGIDMGKNWKAVGQTEIYKGKLENLANEGLVEIDGNTMYLTPIGLAVTGYLIPRFLSSAM